jgi:integrase
VASIFKRGQAWWIKYYVGGRPVQRSLGTTDRNLAQAKKKEIEYLAAARRLSVPSRTPLEPLLETYVEHLRVTRKKKSAQTDIGRLNTFFDAFPVANLEDLAAGMVQEYLDRRVLAGEIVHKTANDYRVILHSLFEYAIRFKGFVSRDPQYPNPMKKVRRFRQPARDIRYLNLGQIDEQLSALEPWLQMRATVATLIYAGLRRAETLWLTVDDVKLRSSPPMLHIRPKEINGRSWEPKTKRPRVVPVSKALKAILAGWMLRRPTGSPWVFPSPAGCRYDEDNWSWALRKVQKKVGMPWTCLDFRHTFGSLLAQKGESLYVISTLMGNSPQIARKHYAALVPEDMADTVEFRSVSPRTHKRKINAR